MANVDKDPAAADQPHTSGNESADDTNPRRSQEPTRPRTAPPQRNDYEEPKKSSKTAGLWAALIIGVLILILLLIFIVQNNVPAAFNYLGWQFQLPLGVAMLFAAIAGALITVMVGSVRMMVLGRRVKRLEKERRQIRQTLGD